MNKYLLPLCAALLLLPTAAFAAPSASTNAVSDEGAKVVDGPTREYIFEDDSIEGEVLTPGGVHVGGSKAREHESMIGVRGEFIPQLIALSYDI